MIRRQIVRPSAHEAGDVLDLVADVQAYPAFIPWIKALRVWDSTRHNDAMTFKAEVTIGYKLLRERFTCQVTVDHAARTVAVAGISGPIRHLRNVWRIAPAARGSEIDFLIEVDLKIPMLQKILQQSFDAAMVRLLRCFEDEADRRFTASGAPPAGRNS